MHNLSTFFYFCVTQKKAFYVKIKFLPHGRQSAYSDKGHVNEYCNELSVYMNMLDAKVASLAQK
jgi:phage terminase small subunit